MLNYAKFKTKNLFLHVETILIVRINPDCGMLFFYYRNISSSTEYTKFMKIQIFA